MAVMVLLYFTDEEMAKGFVKASVLSTEDDAPMKVFGVYKRPTQFCDCIGGAKTKARGFTRGRRYGWWVCGTCKKPTKKWSSGNTWYTTLGTNLLPRKLRPYEEEMSPSLESDAVWSFISVENPHGQT